MFLLADEFKTERLTDEFKTERLTQPLHERQGFLNAFILRFEKGFKFKTSSKLKNKYDTKNYVTNYCPTSIFFLYI